MASLDLADLPQVRNIYDDLREKHGFRILDYKIIPVVSVNTKKVAVSIVRIGDRNLLPTVRSEDFLAQLSAYRLNQYIETDGKKIWSGSLDVTPEPAEEIRCGVGAAAQSACQFR